MNTKKNINFLCLIALILCALLILTSCTSRSASNDGNKSRGSTDTFLEPKASGDKTFSNNGVTIDSSNVSDGYIMIKSDTGNRMKVQINGPSSDTYSYTLNSNKYETFPLTTGNGKYEIQVYENVHDDMYVLSLTETIDVNIEKEFSPFLYPNQYAWYEKGMEAMTLGMKLSEESTSDLGFVETVYNYVVKNIDYDYEKASNIPTDYIPDIDEAIKTGKGICFDYASLMTSILRAQGVPTKLVVGYSGSVYHAWISVYTEETGWVDNVIEFDGEHWSLMDPTLAASNDNKSVKDYVGDGNNYTVKYTY